MLNDISISKTFINWKENFKFLTLHKNTQYMVIQWHPLFLIFLYLKLSLIFQMRTVLSKFIQNFWMFLYFTLFTMYRPLLFHKLKHWKKPHLHVGRIPWCSWSCCEPRSNSCSVHTSGSSPGPKRILGQTTTYIYLFPNKDLNISHSISFNA